MKATNLIPVCLTMLFFWCCEQAPLKPDPVMTPDFYDYVSDSKAPYDSLFAKKTGADGYGMKRYVMAFLKDGPNRSQDSLTTVKLQKAHLQNIVRMADEGKLVLAGPFMDGGEVAGIYVFNVSTVEEAQALTATDPMIEAGRLTMELRPWYGSAALSVLTPLHKRLEKTSVAD